MDKPDIFQRIESDVQSYARAFPCTFDRAIGTEMWDIDNNRYLDFLSGCGSLNYGHNNPALKTPLLDYITKDSIVHGLDMHTAAKARFLESLEEIILRPRQLDYVVQFTGPTGTNAVEAALKIARKVTGRSNVICFTNAFHGVSAGALAATGNQYHRQAAGTPLWGTTHMPFDGYLDDGIDTIRYLDKMLSDSSSGIDKPAAVIVETVQGEGGLNVASDEWLRKLSTLCSKQQILLIIDDIQAGCGRTGSFFSFESAGIKPDIITLSKSLSGYGLPLALVLLDPSLDKWKPGEHNGTFRGNNHAFVTATAALEHYWRSTSFADSVIAKGERLTSRLQRLSERFPDELTEVRGRGMMQGIYCKNPALAAAVTSKAFKQGLIIERSGAQDDVIKCLMPLTISYEELNEGLDILGRVIFQELGSTLPKSRQRSNVYRIPEQSFAMNARTAQSSS